MDTNKDDYITMSATPGCLFVAMNTLEKIKTTEDKTLNLGAILAFGQLCSTCHFFDVPSDADKKELQAMADKAEELAQVAFKK